MALGAIQPTPPKCGAVGSLQRQPLRCSYPQDPRTGPGGALPSSWRERAIRRGSLAPFKRHPVRRSAHHRMAVGDRKSSAWRAPPRTSKDEMPGRHGGIGGRAVVAPAPPRHERGAATFGSVRHRLAMGKGLAAGGLAAVRRGFFHEPNSSGRDALRTAAVLRMLLGIERRRRP